MTIEYLYNPGCPTEATAPDLLRSVLEELGLPSEFRAIPVRTEQEAVARRFLGSPTIQINGRDVDPAAEQRSDYGLG